MGDPVVFCAESCLELSVQVEQDNGGARDTVPACQAQSLAVETESSVLFLLSISG